MTFDASKALYFYHNWGLIFPLHTSNTEIFNIFIGNPGFIFFFPAKVFTLAAWNVIPYHHKL
ncbi:hypothetical protein ES705_00015 [subsurface metagenome]